MYDNDHTYYNEERSLVRENQIKDYKRTDHMCIKLVDIPSKQKLRERTIDIVQRHRNKDMIKGQNETNDIGDHKPYHNEVRHDKRMQWNYGRINTRCFDHNSNEKWQTGHPVQNC